MLPQERNIQELFETATVYARAGDVYNAVKLFKRLVRLAPEWLPPYLQLARIYKDRKEWKAVHHYNKKAVALDPSLKDAWWDLGIAAIATNKLRLARTIWQKFGLESGQYPQLVSIRLRHSGLDEMVWAQQLDPARAIIGSIPHPGSGRNYQDIILISRELSGYNVAGERRYPVYDQLDLYKRSTFQTFSCFLYEANEQALEQLAQLCKKYKLGFEVWSNATRNMAGKKTLPEYYGQKMLPEPEDTGIQVALAARRQEQAEYILSAWCVISLASHSDLIAHT